MKIESVLIIDDDQILADTLIRAFVRRDIICCSASTMAAALQQAKVFKPSHALIDLKLNSESGLDVVKALYELDPEINIVVLTGYASLKTAVNAIKLGARQYLAKPAKIDAIIKALTGLDEVSTQLETPDVTPKNALKTIESEHIQQVLNESGYNISEAARRLGLHRRTLARKLAKKHIL